MIGNVNKKAKIVERIEVYMISIYVDLVFIEGKSIRLKEAVNDNRKEYEVMK
jgi:hypothetical protein